MATAGENKNIDQSAAEEPTVAPTETEKVNIEVEQTSASGLFEEPTDRTTVASIAEKLGVSPTQLSMWAQIVVAAIEGPVVVEHVYGILAVAMLHPEAMASDGRERDA